MSERQQGLLSIGLIIGALITVGILTAIWQGITSGGLGGDGGLSIGLPSIDTSVGLIDLPDAWYNAPVIGGILTRFFPNGMNELIAIMLLSGFIFGNIAGAGITLTLLYRLLSNSTATVKASDEYQAAVSELQTQEKAFVKKYVAEQPPTEIPDHTEKERNWAAISTIFTMGVLGMFLGAAFSDNFMGGGNQFNISLLFGAVGLALGWLLFNRRNVDDSYDNQKSGIDWGNLFIILTGALVVGIGLGIMMWVRAQGV